MKTTKRVKRKKFEWSKFITTIVCIICTVISVWCIYTYFELCKLAIMYNSMSMPDATLPVTSITALLGSILSYLIYQATLKNSLNKNKLNIDDQTGAIRAIQSMDVSSVIDAANRVISNSYENQHVDNLVDSIQQDMLKQDSHYEEPVEVQNIEEE